MKIITNVLPKIKVSYHRVEEDRPQAKINRSSDAFDVFLSVWDMDTIELYEEFKVVYLARNNSIIGYRNLSSGTSCSTLVDLKHLMSIAISCNAQAIVLGHNHPSGSVIPSGSDRKLTSKIQEVCELFDINLMDHIIMSKFNYTSFADEGWI